MFYKLEVSRERTFVDGSEANDWESIVCSRNPGHQRPGRRVTSLFIDVLSWNVVDFSRTMLSDIVISDHARQVLQSAKLTGYDLRPAEVLMTPARVSRAALPRLWELVVVGKGGPAHKDSGIAKLRDCSECGLIEYSAFRNGIVVDPSTYDGSDFFTVVEYPKYILVSERAKATIEGNRLTNATFIDSTEVEWPHGVVEPT